MKFKEVTSILIFTSMHVYVCMSNYFTLIQLSNDLWQLRAVLMSCKMNSPKYPWLSIVCYYKRPFSSSTYFQLPHKPSALVFCYYKFKSQSWKLRLEDMLLIAKTTGNCDAIACIFQALVLGSLRAIWFSISFWLHKMYLITISNKDIYFILLRIERSPCIENFLITML